VDALRKQKIIQVSFNPQINVEILPDSFEVISFYRDIASAGFTFYAAAPKPTWTQERAIKEARDWYKTVIGTFPKNVGTPVTEFMPGLDPPKYYDGQWSIRWPRIDSQGHQFYQDTISGTLNEKYGITSFANNFISKYTDGQKILVSKDQAIEIGRATALKLLGSPLAADWSAGLSLHSAATAELWIVNPYHILNYKSFEAMMEANEGSLNARLAWVTEYRAENAQGMGRYVDVWVDTETKEILGGDFRN
jgi:hypothetical protein